MKLREIRILTDENISPRVIDFLKDQGIDVLDTKEQKWYGKEDEELLEIAYQEQRFVLTHDSDFGTLAINEGKRNYGIIYLRLRNLVTTQRNGKKHKKARTATILSRTVTAQSALGSVIQVFS